MNRSWISRRHFTDFAKIIRNTCGNNRENVARAFANYCEVWTTAFDRKSFMQIATGKVEGDPKTDVYSLLKESINESTKV